MGMMQRMLGMSPGRFPGRFPGMFPGRDAPQRLASNRFDQLVNAINRLPRPLMALGTLLLFADAMLDPAGFADRMAALQSMPEPLWWLVGGVITFYFGARETHYLRQGTAAPTGAPTGASDPCG